MIVGLVGNTPSRATDHQGRRSCPQRPRRFLSPDAGRVHTRAVPVDPRAVAVRPAAWQRIAPAWQRIALEQSGAIARHQLLALGLTRSQAARFVANGQWRTLFPAVYLTHRGPEPEEGVAWAALLYAGQGAALSHGTALWLDGVLDVPPALTHVTIPGRRRVTPQAGLRIHRASSAPAKTHPSRSPTRTRIEDSVLDHLESANMESVIDVLTRATQRRLTTAARLRGALADRARHPHRSLIAEVLAEVDHGAHSPLERRYLREIERGHGLPRGRRNAAEHSGLVRSYHDVRYRRWSTVVELDGRAAHPVEEAFRDFRRDNRVVVAGDVVLRYGWRDVACRPCAVAAQVAEVLQARGWPGAPRVCSPGCPVNPAA